MKLCIRVPSGDEFPRGYGIAWREYHYDGAMCMPVPLNLVCGLAWRAFRWARRATLGPGYIERCEIRAYLEGCQRGRLHPRRIAYAKVEYNRGFLAGYDEGYRKGRNDGMAGVHFEARES